MHKAGVRLLAGSDSLDPYVFPGDSLHHELELLVRAGLPPADALRAATLGAAEFFGLESELGTIEEGKRGDLVLLEANPLENISNTRRIAAIIQNGRWMTPQEILDRASSLRMFLNVTNTQ
jgi:imidazolonepropionase-like amidohydrolase